MDFLLLVSNQLSNERVVIEDSSAEGASRIRLVIDQARVVEAAPETTVVFMGGG